MKSMVHAMHPIHSEPIHIKNNFKSSTGTFYKHKKTVYVLLYTSVYLIKNIKDTPLLPFIRGTKYLPRLRNVVFSINFQ